MILEPTHCRYCLSPDANLYQQWLDLPLCAHCYSIVSAHVASHPMGDRALSDMVWRHPRTRTDFEVLDLDDDPLSNLRCSIVNAATMLNMLDEYLHDPGLDKAELQARCVNFALKERLQSVQDYLAAYLNPPKPTP